jgi:26S proteasome non-ATPase regulatory subunit 10
MLLFILDLKAWWTPTHIAASLGKLEILQALFNKGVHLDDKNETGQTGLHYAASKNRVEVGVG